VNGGNLSFDNDITILSLDMSAGTLGGSGNLVVTSACTWTGGTMSGAGTTTINPGVSWTLGGGTLSSRTLLNDGSCALSGGTFQMLGSALFRNRAGATFDIQGDVGING